MSDTFAFAPGEDQIILQIQHLENQREGYLIAADEQKILAKQVELEILKLRTQLKIARYEVMRSCLDPLP